MTDPAESFLDARITANDLASRLLFVVGSALFFDENQQESALLSCLVGSVLFCARPLLDVLRDFHPTRTPEHT